MILNEGHGFPFALIRSFMNCCKGVRKKISFECCNFVDTKDPAASCDSSTNAKKFPPITIRKDQKQILLLGAILSQVKVQGYLPSSELQTVFQLSTSTPVTTGNSHPRAELPSEKRFRTQFGPRTSFLQVAIFHWEKVTTKRLTNYK